LLVLHREEERLRIEGYDPNVRTPVAPPFRFTGDGLRMLSGLITAGLVEIDQRFSGAAYFGGGMPSFTVRLTPRGRGMVDAWLAGEPGRIEAALQQVEPPDVAPKAKPPQEAG